MTRLLLALGWLVLAALPAQACRLALALTIDVSGSIDPGEFRFQMDGLADALEDPEVADALVLSQAAIMVLQWSGQRDQHVSIPWRRMLSYEAVDRLARDVRATKRRWHGGKTAVGEMMRFGAGGISQGGAIACARWSTCRATARPMTAVTRFCRATRPGRSGIIINGLAIDRMGQSVTQFYRNFVAVGPRQFRDDGDRLFRLSARDPGQAVARNHRAGDVMRALAAAVLAAGLLAQTALAQVTGTCRVALTLALDVSSSVDALEYRLQIGGLADALEDPDVVRVILGVPGTSVALQVFEWSDLHDQHIIHDWIEVRGEAELSTLVATLRTHTRTFANGKTGLGQALAFGLRQLQRGPRCGLMKIDVSGDGQSNVGIPPQSLYGRLDFGQVTVNGLAIASDEEALARYYRNFVIHGPGAFVEEAADFTAYAQAIKRKLIRELGVPHLGALPVTGRARSSG